MNALRRLVHLENGQDLLEYAMLASLIAIAAVAGVEFLGNHINDVFWEAIGPSI